MHASIHLSFICPPTLPLIHSSSAHPSSTHLLTYATIHPSIYLSSTSPSIHSSSIHPSNHQCIHLYSSTCRPPFNHTSIYQSIFSSTQRSLLTDSCLPLLCPVPDQHRGGAARRQRDRQAGGAEGDGGRRQRQQANVPSGSVPHRGQGTGCSG